MTCPSPPKVYNEGKCTLAEQTMSQFNANTTEPDDSVDVTLPTFRGLPFLVNEDRNGSDPELPPLTWLPYLMGSIAFVGSILFLSSPLFIVGAVTLAVFSITMAINAIHQKLFERFHEIDELKKEVQKLKNILTQK